MHFFKEQRMKRMFNPNAEERISIDYLVKIGMLTPTKIIGKPPYKPTDKFAKMVGNARIKLLSIGYVLDYGGMFEQSIRIAMRQSLPEEPFDNILKYSEITSQFVFYDHIDREINKIRLIRNKAKSSKITYIA